MDRRVSYLTPAEANLRARLALGGRVRPMARQVPHVTPKDEPEAIMVITFEGLTEREQEAALAAFPGGKRFVLAN